MFSMACVSHSVHRGGGDMHDWGVLLGVGVCMAGGVCGWGNVWLGVSVWLGCAWLGGMCD